MSATTPRHTMRSRAIARDILGLRHYPRPKPSGGGLKLPEWVPMYLVFSDGHEKKDEILYAHKEQVESEGWTLFTYLQAHYLMAENRTLIHLIVDGDYEEPPRKEDMYWREEEAFFEFDTDQDQLVVSSRL